MILLMVLNLYLVSRVTSEEVRYPIRLDNGLRLQGYMWKPKQESNIRALVFINHGYESSHKFPRLRYLDVDTQGMLSCSLLTTEEWLMLELLSAC